MKALLACAFRRAASVLSSSETGFNWSVWISGDEKEERGLGSDKEGDDVVDCSLILSYWCLFQLFYLWWSDWHPIKIFRIIAHLISILLHKLNISLSQQDACIPKQTMYSYRGWFICIVQGWNTSRGVCCCGRKGRCFDTSHLKIGAG